MEEKDFIKELFQEKLAQHQSPVSPELWASVSTSITTGTTVVSSGLSLLTKSIIGGLSAAAVIGGVWMLTQQKTSSTKTVRSKEIKKTATQTKSTDEKAAIKSTSKPGESYGCVFLIPEIPKEDNGPAFGPGTLHGGSGSASCSPFISLTNKDPEVIPTLPMQAIVSSQQHAVIPEQNRTAEPSTVEIVPNSTVQVEAIILPNIFTPNGDGKNDEFSIDLNNYEFIDFSLVILDLNNQIVFKSNDPKESWNGKSVDGSLCSSGNYLYYLTGKTIQGETISKYSKLRIQY
ncbi:MAG: gliding motility-associated C-terminal domain-containing protein [Flavobacteriales bacterium]